MGQELNREEVTVIELERACSNFRQEIMELRLEMKDIQMDYVKKDAQTVSDIMSEIEKRVDSSSADLEKLIEHCPGIGQIQTTGAKLDGFRREIAAEIANLKAEISKVTEFKDKLIMAMIGAYISAGVSAIFLIVNLIFSMKK